MIASESTLQERPSPRARIVAMVGIALLHIACYYVVNLTNSRRSATVFVDLTLTIDGWIPYIGWTWVIYYFGDLYIIFWAGAVFWQIPRARFVRAVYAYGGMIVVGATVQLLVPATAPWPASPADAQQWVHELISMRPHACLPSMHVALTVLPAGFAVSVLQSRSLRVLSVILAALITVSTLTLKEHFFLDAVSGVVLGVAAYAFWRAGRAPAPKSPTA
jgi:hypothetical protein